MKKAIISVHHANKEHISIPLLLEDGHQHTKLIRDISDNGTSHLKMLKFPTSEISFVVISKEQLNNSVVEIFILPDEEEEKKEKKTRTKKLLIEE